MAGHAQSGDEPRTPRDARALRSGHPAHPIDTMLLLRQLQPEQVASLSPPAVARLVATFRERAETLVFANPLLREALSQTASV